MEREARIFKDRGFPSLLETPRIRSPSTASGNSTAIYSEGKLVSLNCSDQNLSTLRVFKQSKIVYENFHDLLPMRFSFSLSVIVYQNVFTYQPNANVNVKTEVLVSTTTSAHAQMVSREIYVSKVCVYITTTVLYHYGEVLSKTGS